MTATRRKVEDVPIGIRDLREFVAVHGEERVNQTFERVAELRELIGDRTVWNVNSTAVVGTVDQIDDGVEGFLVDDPRDIGRFAEILERLIRDPELRAKMGEAARERVREQFLNMRHLLDYAELLGNFVR